MYAESPTVGLDFGWNHIDSLSKVCFATGAVASS